MIDPPVGVRVYLATGVTDMRKGFDGLTALIQQRLRQDPFGGAVYAFRGRRGDLVKLLWRNGQGLVLHAKRLERVRRSAGLLAHMIVFKYADRLPLYRRSGIYARHGVDLARSTLADWVGRSATLLRPLVDALERHVMGGPTLHADDTHILATFSRFSPNTRAASRRR